MSMICLTNSEDNAMMPEFDHLFLPFRTSLYLLK
jgi:hypothetical protein